MVTQQPRGPAGRSRNGWSSPAAKAAMLGAILAVCCWLAASFSADPKPQDVGRAGDSSRKEDGSTSAEPKTGQLPVKSRHPVTIRPGPATPRTLISVPGTSGETAEVACSTCHTSRTPNVANRGTSDLDEFHQELSVSHGSLTCLSCHNAKDYDSLRLADGTTIAFPDVMQLCAQCHGAQSRDFEHGAHGGMTGFWDLSRGPRQRNNCIDCHHPHAPQFPKMKPTFKPRDRFLDPASSHTDTEIHGADIDE